MPAGVSAYTPLATITIGSSQPNNVTFSSISQSYRDLVLVVSCSRVLSGQGVLRMRLNGDAGNYTYINTAGISSGANSSSGSGTWMSFAQYDMTLNNAKTSLIVNFFDYSQTDKTKQITSRMGLPQAATVMTAGRWNSTAGINQIYLEIENAFLQGSILSLYGVSA
jgi:hypothetical protein